MFSHARRIVTRGTSARRPELRWFRPQLCRLEERTVPATFLVDDDFMDNPAQRRFDTISEAVAAASAGDRILVARGTYEEQVVIPANKDNLDIIAIGRQSQTEIIAPTTFTDPTEAIVHVAGAEGVEIRGFTIRGNRTSANGPNYGVLVDQGGSAEVEDNRITAIRNQPLNGEQEGIGIQFGFTNSAGTVLSTGRGEASDNVIDNYQKGGIVVIGTGSEAKVENNKITGAGPTGVIAQNGIQVSDGAKADVRRNVVAGNKFTGTSAEGVGILVFESSNVRIRGNTVFGNDEGILLFADSPARAVTNSVVSDNKAFNNTFNGIGLFNANNNKVEDNFVSFNGFDGINLEEADNNRIEDNVALFNGRYGIALEATTAGNHIVDNKARRNVVADIFDDSEGNGTAGTANFYRGNRAGTTIPDGLAGRFGRGGHGHGRDGDDDDDDDGGDDD